MGSLCVIKLTETNVLALASFHWPQPAFNAVARELILKNSVAFHSKSSSSYKLVDEECWHSTLVCLSTRKWHYDTAVGSDDVFGHSPCLNESSIIPGRACCGLFAGDLWQPLYRKSYTSARI